LNLWYCGVLGGESLVGAVGGIHLRRGEWWIWSVLEERVWGLGLGKEMEMGRMLGEVSARLLRCEERI
jgi:hypothetical protein